MKVYPSLELSLRIAEVRALYRLPDKATETIQYASDMVAFMAQQLENAHREIAALKAELRQKRRLKSVK